LHAGLEYEYTMVGTDPAQTSATTVVPTEIISFRFVFSNGIVLDASTDQNNGVTILQSVLNSPIFQPASFSAGNTSLGFTQFGDAYQRGNFWNFISTKSPDYHVLLGQPTIFNQTLIVPADKGSAGPPQPGSNQILGKVDVDWLDGQIRQLLATLSIDQGSLPIFLSHNTVLAFGNQIAAFGYHDFVQSPGQSGGQTLIVSCYLDENLFDRTTTDESDILTLSHEVGEWLDDPFVNNIVPNWQYPGVSSCFEDFFLEVGDAVQDTRFPRITTALNGMTYHLQDLVFLSWFARTSPSTAVNGYYTLANGLNAFSESCPNGPIYVQFDSSSYTVDEAAKVVSVRVTRTGDPNRTLSVEFATSDSAGAQNCNVKNGIASSHCDYETRVANVTFAPGETSKTISVFIIDDSFAEGPESFNVNLSNPVGASLGTAATATVTITDNDAASGSNQIDTPSFFVRSHYLDFLNREPDQSGLAFWSNQISSCGADQTCLELRRINVSAAFYLSIEFQQTGYLVERIYKAAYGDVMRPSSLGGTHQLAVPVVRLNDFLRDTQEIGQGVVVNQTGWEQVLENNKQAFAVEFARRLRFTIAFSTSMTPTQFVSMLFVNAGVTPSASERQAAIDEFGAAATSADALARGRALRRVAENSTLAQTEFNPAFVLMQYFGYLRRNPGDPQDTDYTGYDFWLTKLNAFNGNFVGAEMVKAFINSAEYRQRFGSN